MFFSKIFSKQIFLGTLFCFVFRKFSFREKICFWNFLIMNFFFFKINNFSEFLFFSKKMLVANFMRFRRKRLQKRTRIDNFSLKKNPQQIYLASLYLLMSWYTIKEVSKIKKNPK